MQWLATTNIVVDLFSHRLHLSLPRKLPLATNPLHLPENNIGLLGLLARCLVLGRPFTTNRHNTLWFLQVLPFEYHRKFVLNRYTRAAGILETCFELVVIVDVVVNSGDMTRSDVFIKMYGARAAYLTTRLGSTWSSTALRAISSFGWMNKVSLICVTH